MGWSGRGWEEEDLLRARKRSSERMAMALTRRMETEEGGLARVWKLWDQGGFTVEEVA